MVVTLGQQYNIGEKPTVILYTYINCHAGTPKKQRKQNSTSSNMVQWGLRFKRGVCQDLLTSLKPVTLLNRFKRGSSLKPKALFKRNLP